MAYGFIEIKPIVVCSCGGEMKAVAMSDCIVHKCTKCGTIESTDLSPAVCMSRGEYNNSTTPKPLYTLNK